MKTTNTKQERIDGHIDGEDGKAYKVIGLDGTVYALTAREEEEIVGYDAGDAVTFEVMKRGEKPYAKNVVFRQ